MKTLLPRTLLLAGSLAAASLLASCASDYHQDTRYNRPADSGYRTYASLPSDYSGDAYYYNDRYYAGGRYEQGPFTYRGRTYDHRYLYDGRYFYGGEYRPQTAVYRGPATSSSTPVRYVTYRTLPRDYSGDAYYYNNQYYAGGRYEQGPFSYGGHTYDHRYFHNGRYYYGGEYRPSPSAVYGNQRSVSNYRPTTRSLVY